jgi:adenylate kinase family enzyme
MKQRKMIKKIHIVGIYGSGKSTLAKKLSEYLKIKSYDLDEIKYKRKYDIIRPLNKRLKIVEQISKKKSWITEGAWLDYAALLYKKADLVIFLEIPEGRLYWRIFLRHFKRKFHKGKYKEHNLKTTISILKKVRKYFHDSSHFMTLKTHKEYIQRYAKKTLIIKKKKDLNQLIQLLK